MPANSGTKLHGKNAAVYLGGAKGSGGIKVATKTEWTLQRNRDYVDATSFGDTNKTYLAGLPNVQGTFAGFLDTSGDLLLNAATSDATDIYLYADDSGSAVLIANGPGFIDGSCTAGVNDAIRFTGEFRAQGAWTIFQGS